ncbi:hypothetical protein [Dinoroseobacter sp. S124A]|uniref:hypothetical protein n=1 Tax=Dinoroseobacter sp. S124A TaxID=3415128 RepID=UPI003C79B5DF
MLTRTQARCFVLLFWIVGAAASASAQEKRFTLHADPALVEAGLIKFLLPRFSMKTNTRVTLSETAETGAAQLVPGGAAGAQDVIASGDEVWSLSVPEGDANAARFADWLTSDVGKRTIASFAPEGRAGFTAAADRPVEVVARDLSRDTTEGISLSLVHCGRCHVIGPQNRHNSIGSTPSFGLLRSFPNWQERFETFYVLNPHPAFTQIAEVTAPFDPGLPSPIHPLSMTLEELDEILAYVATMAPADLGAPIRHQ